MKKIYLAGPMRGLPGCNFEAFDRAAEAWRAAGWHPISPTDMDRLLGNHPQANGTFAGPDGSVEETRASLAHMAVALATCVLAVDAIALLPGWERSRGATYELALAQFLGLEVYDAVTQERIAPPLTPWGQLSDVEAWIGPVLEDSVEPRPNEALHRMPGTTATDSSDWAEVWRGSAEACIEREEQRRKQAAQEALDLAKYREELDKMPVHAPGVGHSY